MGWETVAMVRQVALDQIRSVDWRRLVNRLGATNKETAAIIANVLVEMFAPKGD